MYHDLTDVEILIIDNYGDDRLDKMVANKTNVRCIRWTDKPGSGVPRNRIFENANGDWVVNIDSHIMLKPGAIDRLKEWIRANPECQDMFHGPLLFDDLSSMADSYQDKWQGCSWGVWNMNNVTEDTEPYEIKLMGIGLFGCRKDAWQGFNEDFVGFGGVEGYIHEKHRLAGHKVICLPFLQWVHYFKNKHGKQEPVPYPLTYEDRIHNYLLGFRELHMDLKPVYDLFGKDKVNRVDHKFFTNPQRFGYEWRGNGGSAIGEDDWAFINDVVVEYRPIRILEFGLGLSTCMFDAIGCHTTTWETEQKYIDQFLKQTGLKPDIKVWDGKTADINPMQKYQLAFVDGPLGGENREHSIRLAGENSDLVIVHDAFRPADASWQEKHLKDKGFNLIRTGGCDNKYCNLWIRA